MAEFKEINGVKCVRIEMRVLMKRRKDEQKTKFPTYQYLDRKNKWKDLKFGKEVQNRPTTACIIYVPEGKTHLENPLYAKFPARWVEEIAEAEALLRPAEVIEVEDKPEEVDRFADL